MSPRLLKQAWLSLMVLMVFTFAETASSWDKVKFKSYFEIKIALTQDVYLVDELLEGKVTMDNSFPATVPVTFQMTMTHNGRLKHQSQVYVKTFPPGVLSFDFRTFRIPQKAFKAADVGHWVIRIKQLHADDAYAVRAEFDVMEKDKHSLRKQPRKDKRSVYSY